MTNFRRKYLPMHPEAGGDAGAAGGGAGATSTQAGASGGAGDAGAGAGAGGGGADGASLLAQGVGAAAGAGDPLAWLHEQHRVMGADGKIDEAASMRKQAENYAPLAKRMREVGAPPKTADDYTFEVPEALKGKYDPAADQSLGEFKKLAFEHGLTPKQYQAVVAGYAERMPALAEALFSQNREKGEQALRSEWKSDEQFTAGLRNAAAAVKGFDPGAFGADGEIMSEDLKPLMNNPFFLKMAAHFGAQMQEDTSPGSGDALPAGSPYRGMTLPQLESNEAYLNPRHPDHQVISRMVQQVYHKQTGESIGG